MEGSPKINKKMLLNKRGQKGKLLHASFIAPLNPEDGEIFRNVGSKVVKRKISNKYCFIEIFFFYPWTGFHSILSFTSISPSPKDKTVIANEISMWPK